MSADQPSTQPSAAIQDGLSDEALVAALAERFAVELDPQAFRGACVVIPAAQLHDAIAFLRNDPRLRFDLLLDITAVDYLAFPGWRDERFAVVYLLRSLQFRHRIRLKVMVEEGEESLPTISDLFRIADWTEREVYDQYGIRFAGHPNLKRILNHHEFVGHPLRKDYPVQKRQHLSINDPMIDELTAALERQGYEILEHEATSPEGQDPATQRTEGVA
jgi:NADH-quinone oxidoreductase subunit C